MEEHVTAVSKVISALYANRDYFIKLFKENSGLRQIFLSENLLTGRETKPLKC